MGGGLVAMRLHPRDFRFQHRDPLAQFVLRIGGKILARELARGVASGAGAIIVIHYALHSQASRLAVNPGKG